MTTAIICCTIMFVCVCIVYCMNKQIAAWIYVKTVNPDAVNKTSPYGLSRERGKDEMWGYCITKNGKIVYSNGRSAIVYKKIDEAIADMNILEKLEGYEKTKL